MEVRAWMQRTLEQEAGTGPFSQLKAAPPTMAGEDFGFFLEKIPGLFLWIGQGAAPDGPGVRLRRLASCSGRARRRRRRRVVRARLVCQVRHLGREVRALGAELTAHPHRASTSCT